MKKEDFAYCGLNCSVCRERFADIRTKMESLDKALTEVNITEMVKVIPFMGSNYKGYIKFIKFFSNECPGCRENGGNPFCGIRKCVQKKGFETCVECDDDICKKFSSLLKIHSDNEIQNNRELIRKL